LAQTSGALSGGAGGAATGSSAHAANRGSDRSTFAGVSGNGSNRRARGRTPSGTANCTGRRFLT